MYFRLPRLNLRLALLGIASVLVPTLLFSKWTKSQYEHVTFVSNASKNDVEIKAEALWEARLGLNFVFPSLTQIEDEPLIIVYAGNKNVREELTYSSSTNKNDIVGFYSKDPDGHFAVITDDATFVDGRQVLVHEYVHFLTEKQKSAPIWLREGIAELFSTIHQNTRGKLVIGEAVSINVLYMQLAEMLPCETLLNLEVDSPEYDPEKHSGPLYSQSWLLFHYLLFGEHDLDSSGVKGFIENAFSSPKTSEQSILHYLGLSYSELDERLATYIKRGEFGLYAIDLDSKYKFQSQPFESLSKVEKDQLFGRIKLVTKETIVSEKWIEKSFEKWSNDPEINVNYGYALLNRRDYEAAYQCFEMALKEGLNTPRLHIGLAISLLNIRSKDRTQKLTEAETITCLRHIFEARKLGGGRSPELYLYAANIWNASQVRPEDKHMSIIREGLYWHPESVELAISLASFYQATGQLEASNTIIQKTLPYLTTRRRDLLLQLFPQPDDGKLLAEPSETTSPPDQ